MDVYDNFALENKTPRWKVSNAVLVFFRVLSVLLMIGTLTMSFTFGQKRVSEHFYLYLTQWGIIMTLLYFLVSLFMFVDKENTTRLSTFFHVVFTLELFITIAFWCLILPTDKNYDPKELSLGMYYLLNSLCHGLPMLCLLVEFFANRIHLTGKNIQALFGLIFAYLVVNFVGTVLMDFSIYSIITYTDVLSYMVLIMSFGLAFVFWVVTLKLQNLKYKQGEPILDI